MIRTSAARRRRPGFTLVELMVVILILAILIALLIPAIMGAVRTAKDAAVSAEIGNLANALADFKSQYGDYPPSRLILREDGYYNTADTTPLPNYGAGTWLSFTGVSPPMSQTDLTYGQLAQRSIKYLRKFFPRATFSTAAPIYPTGPAPGGIWHDFNGDGVCGSPSNANVPILLEGHEALVFFLGGIPNRTGLSANPSVNPNAVTNMAGFNKLPTNPFVSPAAATGQNRQAPMFEFVSSRLIDDDGDGLPGYIDSLGTQAESRYYAYFSSYSNGGYDPNDVNTLIETNSQGAGPISRVFQVTFNLPSNALSSYGNNWVNSLAPNPYTNSTPVPQTGVVTPTVFQNPETFQIISAGRDRNYGVGGQYQADANDRLPITDAAAAWHATPPAHLDGGVRQVEQDNLTNFTNGKLQ